MVGRNAERFRHASVQDEMSNFSVHGNQKLGACHTQKNLEFLAPRMTRYMYVRIRAVDDVGPQLEQVVDVTGDQFFISRYRRR